MQSQTCTSSCNEPRNMTRPAEPAIGSRSVSRSCAPRVRTRKKRWSTYKHEHNIVETGGGGSIDDQRLTDMNDKLNAAHDETFKAKARFDQFSAVRGTEVPRAAASGSNADSAP